MTLVGIDLGGTKLSAAAFTDAGELLERESVPLAGRSGDSVGQLIGNTAQRLVVRHGADALGVCVPGLYRSAQGTVWAPNIPGWDDYPLLAELRNSLDRSVALAIDSDRAAYILGETWQGAARGAEDAIFLAVGTGIGAGILVDGKIVRGHADVAGAIGWLALDRPFHGRYAQHGCFEDQASGPGLVRVALDYAAADTGYNGPLRGGKLDASALFNAYDEGDRIAARAIANAIELWGMAAANLVSLFNPELIVFGGGVFGPALRFLDRIRETAQRWAQPIAVQQVRFVGSTLGGDAGLIGAGRIAMTARSSA